MVACLGMNCVKIMNHHMLLLLKTFISRLSAKKHKLSFYIWEKEAVFSLCGQYSITYSNESWGKKFLTNMIFVQQNKPHRVVQ